MRRIAVLTVALATGTLGASEAVRSTVQLTIGARLASIGVLEGDPAHELGQVRDVVADERGNVYVLDFRLNQVRAFSATAQFIDSAGRAGQGPGEFTNPVAIATGPQGRVHVLDSGNQRLTTWSIRNGRLLEHSPARVALPAQDMCVIGDRAYVLAYHADRIVHEVGLGTGAMRSFGAAIVDAHPVLRGGVSFGRVACVPAKRLVIVVPRFFPEIRAYDVDGRLVWAKRLSGFIPLDFQVDPQRRTGRMSVPKGGVNHLATDVVALTPSIVAIQLERQTTHGADASKRESVVETRYVSVDTGDELGVQLGLPAIRFAADQRLYTVTDDPFPGVNVYPYRVMQRAER